MRVTGDVRRAGAPLAAGARLDGPPALELAPKATLHLVHTSSTRQWVVSGPARLVACAGGAEELSLARGSLRVAPGAGVRPGAEVWIGTPFGSLRYADAQAEISADARALTLRIASGEVWFAPLGGSTNEEQRLAPGSTRLEAAPYRLPSERAIERCGRDAELAQSRAQALLGPLSRPLGQLAAEHVRARQRAHASCASAQAATLAQAPARDHEAGFAALARYDQLWRAVPAAPAPREP
jgi:hypothetical protein